mmetsp:Transcript_83178/g.165097  ORF Transcript_83178/g.165097 Transcript_83178/m.165097 type:complete len:314 (-) Transcript_83178:450-1391(-)
MLPDSSRPLVVPVWAAWVLEELQRVLRFSNSHRLDVAAVLTDLRASRPFFARIRACNAPRLADQQLVLDDRVLVLPSLEIRDQLGALLGDLHMAAELLALLVLVRRDPNIRPRGLCNLGAFRFGGGGTVALGERPGPHRVFTKGFLQVGEEVSQVFVLLRHGARLIQPEVANDLRMRVFDGVLRRVDGGHPLHTQRIVEHGRGFRDLVRLDPDCVVLAAGLLTDVRRVSARLIHVRAGSEHAGIARLARAEAHLPLARDLGKFEPVVHDLELRLEAIIEKHVMLPNSVLTLLEPIVALRGLEELQGRVRIADP